MDQVSAGLVWLEAGGQAQVALRMVSRSTAQHSRLLSTCALRSSVLEHMHTEYSLFLQDAAEPLPGSPGGARPDTGRPLQGLTHRDSVAQGQVLCGLPAGRAHRHTAGHTVSSRGCACTLALGVPAACRVPPRRAACCAAMGSSQRVLCCRVRPCSPCRRPFVQWLVQHSSLRTADDSSLVAMVRGGVLLQVHPGHQASGVQCRQHYTADAAGQHGDAGGGAQACDERRPLQRSRPAQQVCVSHACLCCSFLEPCAAQGSGSTAAAQTACSERYFANPSCCFACALACHLCVASPAPLYATAVFRRYLL